MQMNLFKYQNHCIFLLALTITSKLFSKEKTEFFDGWRISVHNWTEVKAKFGLLQSGISDPGNDNPASEHFYDDGYVRVDDTGNFGNLTTFWGYENDTQVMEESGNRTFTFHSVQPEDGPDGLLDQSDRSRNVAFEIEGLHFIRKDKLGLTGIETGLGYFTTSILQDGDLELLAVTDSYDGNMPTIPEAGYHGSPDDTTPYLLGDNPVRTLSKLQGSREIDARFWLMHMGIYHERNFNDEIALSIHAGAKLAHVRSNFTYEEDFSGKKFSGKTTDSSILLGAYLSILATYIVTDEIRIFSGYQYLGIEDYQINDGRRQAVLDLSQNNIWKFGIGWEF